MGTLEKLVEDNTYPITFIGAGMSFRYLEDYPKWSDLIQLLWSKAFQGTEQDYIKYVLQKRQELEIKYPSYHSKEIDFYLNTELGLDIEQQFNKSFIDGIVKIDNYSLKNYLDTRISPFKKEISNIFSRLSPKPGMEDEYASFQRFLSKTKIILTTNYDQLIENAFNSYAEDQKLDCFVGQKGFLRENTGWAELYKVHGSNTEPNSIVFTKSDYEEFDKKSVLISAKIISSLITSPIIFLGYSLTDINIRKIIKDFATSINPEEGIAGSDRIIVVEHKRNENEIIEMLRVEKDLGTDITLIQTDNYKQLFDKLSEINEGVSSAFINRYQSILKKMIIERGKEGSLQSLLISPTELSEMENNHELRKNAAVVIGDSTIVFSFPDTISYFIDYFEENKINTEVAIHYIASITNTNTRIPFHFYTNHLDIDNSSLNPRERDKLLKRYRVYSMLKPTIDSITKYNKIELDSINKIKKQNLKQSREIDLVTFNIERIPKEEALDYLLTKLHKLSDKNEYVIPTEIRRLAVAFDILYVKNEITKAP